MKAQKTAATVGPPIDRHVSVGASGAFAQDIAVLVDESPATSEAHSANDGDALEGIARRCALARYCDWFGIHLPMKSHTV